jgi:hypothetical protein
MRIFGAVVLAASMFVTSAFAATGVNTPLAPGGSAGVKAAQSESNTLLWVVGVGVVAAGIALVASGDSNKGLAAGVTSTSTSASASSSTTSH